MAFAEPRAWAPKKGAITFCNVAPEAGPGETKKGKNTPAAQEELWDPSSIEVVPGVLLDKMRLPPAKWSEVPMLGRPTWNGPALSVPPDGLCMIYAFLAALKPKAWEGLSRSDLGFVEDRFLEQTLKTAALLILDAVIAACRAARAAEAAAWLAAGRHPGDSELRFYAEIFQAAFLVVPSDPNAFPIIHGDGPVGFAVAHRLSYDGAGAAAGHFELLKSWLPLGFDDTLQLPLQFNMALALALPEEDQPRDDLAPNAGVGWCTPQGQTSGMKRPAAADRSQAAAPKRRMRGKRPAPAAYGGGPANAAGSGRVASPARKKPAGKRGKTHYCSGKGPRPCCFNAAEPGTARYLAKGQRRCMFCDEAQLKQALASPRGLGTITRALKCFAAFPAHVQHVFQAALDQVGAIAPEHLEEFRHKATMAKRIKKAKATAKEKEAQSEEQWAAAKAQRQATGAAATHEERKNYRAKVLENQRRGLVQFYPETPRLPRASGADLAATVDNHSKLPPATTSDLAIGLQRWCQTTSWGICPNCKWLQPRAMEEKHLRLIAKPEIAASACRNCAAKRPHIVPTPEDVPAPLRGLSAEMVEALRPLDIDVGPEVRAAAGFRKKVRMITFAWCLTSVDDKIDALPRPERKQAKAALKYLLKMPRDNEYSD